MDLKSMRQMIAVAEHGHMTRAAEELGVTQPALSAALRKLEEELGTELFHRTGHGVEATEAGKVFVEHAKITLRASQQTSAPVRRPRATCCPGRSRLCGKSTRGYGFLFEKRAAVPWPRACCRASWTWGW